MVSDGGIKQVGLRKNSHNMPNLGLYLSVSVSVFLQS